MDVHRPPKEAVDPRYRLLPTVLQHVARLTPDRVYCASPASARLQDGLRELTFGDVASAVDALSFHLEATVGTSTCFETLAYVGANDLRYPVFLLACVKTGHKALFISPRNTAEQNAHLLQRTACTKLYHSPQHAPVAARAAEASADALRLETLKSVDGWIASSSAPYPYSKTFEEARYDPVVVLHSSGSTGTPKPITETHQFFLNYGKAFPCAPGRRTGGFPLFNYEGGGYYFSSFPFYHLGGVISSTVYVIYSRSASFLTGFSDRPAAVETALEIMQMRRTRTLLAPPSIIEGLAKLPQGLQQIRSLDSVIFAGGPLNKSCGDMLSRLVMLSTNYGSTETGTVASYISAPEDWEYLEFHAAWNAKLEQDIDGTYELVVQRDRDADEYRPIGGTIMREQAVYRTKDLFVRHPEKAQLWRFYGRKDDIIVLSNGQKWNPIPSENHIMSNSEAQGVLITGSGRSEPAVLIEMDVQPEDRETLVAKLWPVVQEANSQTQRYGRINRSRIAFVRPATFHRTPKGTIIRKATSDDLRSVIDAMYEDDDVKDDRTTGGVHQDDEPKPALPLDLLPIVRTQAHAIPTVSGIGNDEDLFVRGLDSNEAAEIARTLRSALKLYASKSRLGFLRSHFIFNNPTIADMAAALRVHLTGDVFRSGDRASPEGMIEKYRLLLEAKQLPPLPMSAGIVKVAVTGTTGSLGAQVLRKLLETSSVSEIICLNRSATAKSSFKAETKLGPNQAKITFMTVDFNETGLGLPESDLSSLRDVDACIHCAWEVNFNRSLVTYEHQFRALTDLIGSALLGRHKTRFLFISSISAVADDSPDVRKHGRVPADLVPEVGGSTRMGYAVSKNVGEHLVGLASERLGLPACILRVGQIAGPSDKSDTAAPWNRKEWLPSMVDTSAAIGILPEDLDPVDWVPIDVVARVIVDVAIHDVAIPNLKVYNVVNPQKAAWAPLATAITSCLSTPCKLVPVQSWLRRLDEENDVDTPDTERMPGLKILPYFKRRAMASETGREVDTAATCAVSDTLATLGPIDEHHIRYWMSQWGYAVN